MVLAALAGYGVVVLRGVPLVSVFALPATAVLVDVAIQSLRFPRVRFPDAALASGLFLSLLLPPTVPVLAGVATTTGAIIIRHTLRYRGRPVLNPAATGMILGAALFGLGPAWWVSLGAYGELVLVALGLVLLVRTPRSWMLPAVFLLVYGLFAVVEHVLFGAALSERVLLLTAADPSVVFLGVFMLTEPRTAPSDARAYPLYAAVAALGAVFIPIVLPSLGILVGLLVGNVLAGALRPRGSAAPKPVPRAAARGTRRAAASERRSVAPWSPARRATVGVLTILVIGLIAAGTYSPPATPNVLVGTPSGASTGSSGGGGGGGGLATSCTSDNPSIPSSTLTALHRVLGPSVILKYDSNTGVVVFYDPTNHVTVTETDLYEDFGYAEFNGDDFAVSGCSG
jgi:Na+-translocating ferredoxin:NAD+ oxidoreductase RnfD subunit